MTTPPVQLINPPSRPRIPGYSQVATVTADDLVFIAGQISLDASGAIAGAGGFAARATQTRRNLLAALAAVATSPTSLIKLTSFVTDMKVHDRSAQANVANERGMQLRGPDAVSPTLPLELAARTSQWKADSR